VIQTIAPGASARFDMLESMRGAGASRLQRRGMTAVRLIYDLHQRSITTNADALGSWMVTPLSVDGDVAGVHPDPEEGEQDAAWVWVPFHERRTELVGIHYKGDLRSSRKILGIDYTLEFIYDLNVLSTTSVEVTFAFRMLMKLP